MSSSVPSPIPVPYSFVFLINPPFLGLVPLPALFRRRSFVFPYDTAAFESLP